MKVLVLVKLTVRELLFRAPLIVLACISTLVVLVAFLSISVQAAPEGSTLMMFGNPVGPPASPGDLRSMIVGLEGVWVGMLHLGVVVFGVFATAGVIPETLEKGTIDLYLSKPLSRWELLLGKSTGAIGAVLVNIAYFIGGLWIAVGVRAGIWDTALLLSCLGLIFEFACLYSIIVCLAVASRSTAVVIIGSYLYLFVIANLLLAREHTLYLIWDFPAWRGAADGLYYLLPQLPGINSNLLQLIAGGAADVKPLVQSFVSSGLIFFATGLMLRRKDL